MTRFGMVIATASPSIAALVISGIPGTPAGLLVGAAIALPLLAVGAFCVVLGVGSLARPLANGIVRAMAGAAVALVVRVGGAITAAVTLGHDQPARVAIATIAVCLMAGTMIETALLLRALRRNNLSLGATNA